MFALIFAAVFSIADYGAKADGSKCTAAFAKAIAACTPGGRVTVPKGEWFTGSVRLKSDMELHLEDGAVVRFSDDPKDCLPVVRSTFEGQEAVNYCPLVYAFGCTNVAVTGRGTFVTDQTKWRALQLMLERAPEWRAHYDEFNAWSRANTRPPEARDLTQWGEPWVFRPHFMQFNRCRNVRLEGFKIRYSPFWLVELLCSEDIVCRGLDLFGMFGNSDGIDIESSKRVLIENCTLDQADDAFCVKSGRDEEGRRRGIPTEDVEIRNCRVKHSGGFFTVGSEISGGARNICIHDCTADVVRDVFVLRSYASRGGHIENVTMENCKIDRCNRWFFATRLGWPVDPKKVSADRVCWTTYDGITVRNVSVGDCGSSYNIIGAPAAKYRGIRIENCEIGHLRRPETNALVNVEASVDVSGLRLKNLPKPDRRHINADELLLRPDFDYAAIAEHYGRDLILDYKKGDGPNERLRWERLHNLRRTGWEINITQP